jgi:enoyl-CoA hydratase
VTEFVTVVLPEGGARAHIATLLLSRPPTNALTRQVCREIAEATAYLSTCDDVCAVIVFGGHEIFSVGEDMPELQTLNAAEAEEAGRVFQQAVDALAAVGKPTVAAITGYAGRRSDAGVGGGLAGQR